MVAGIVSQRAGGKFCEFPKEKYYFKLTELQSEYSKVIIAQYLLLGEKYLKKHSVRLRHNLVIT